MLRKIVVAIAGVCSAIWRSFRANIESLAFISAWLLITWSIVGNSLRGWSASVGIYMLVYALLGIIPALLKAVPPKSAVRPTTTIQHPNDA